MAKENEATALYVQIVSKMKPSEILEAEELFLYMACMRGLGSFKQHKDIAEGAQTVNKLATVALGFGVDHLLDFALGFVPYIHSIVETAKTRGTDKLAWWELLFLKTHNKPAEIGVGIGVDKVIGGTTKSVGLAGSAVNELRAYMGKIPGRAPIIAATDKIMRKQVELRRWRDASILRHIAGQLTYNVTPDEALIRDLYNAASTPIHQDLSARDLMMLALSLRQMEKTIKSFKFKWASERYMGVDKILKDPTIEVKEKRLSFLTDRKDAWKAAEKAATVDAYTFNLALELWLFHKTPEFRKRLNEGSLGEQFIASIQNKIPGVGSISANKNEMLTSAGLITDPENLGEIIAMRYAEDFGLLLGSWDADIKTLRKTKDTILAEARAKKVDTFFIDEHAHRAAAGTRLYRMGESYFEFADRVSEHVRGLKYENKSLKDTIGKDAAKMCYRWLSRGMYRLWWRFLGRGSKIYLDEPEVLAQKYTLGS